MSAAPQDAVSAGALPARPPTTRVAAFDTLRAFAALIVMGAHYWHDQAFPGRLAPLSRQFLLVLSGFFLTGILLRYARPATSESIAWWRPIWRFHLRRWLRIYPVYLVCVAVSALLLARLGDGRVRGELGWHLTQMTGVLVFLRGHWGEPGDHLWTLSAIEHFYLLWPLLLLVPARRRWRVCTAALVAGPLALGLLLVLNPSSDTNKALMPACLHFFVAGGMLALLREGASAPGGRIRAAFDRATAALWPWVLVWCGFAWLRTCWPLFTVAADFAAALGMAAVVRAVTRRRSAFGERILSHPVLAYIGRTGFPIYILHPFVLLAFELVRHAHGWPIGDHLLRAAAAIATLLAAAAVHETLEKPLAGWRARI